MSEDLPFGTWLREYRTNHDLTRRDLAQMIGCSLETIRKIESGERRPSKQVATLLAEKLDFSPEERPRFVEYARRLPPPAAPTRRDFAPIKRAGERPQSSGTPNNLRIPLTSLIGRHRELATIFAYLQDTPVRLLTLVGPPGVGKTRIGLQVAHDLLQRYGDGVFFVPLAQITDASRVLDAIAHVVGLAASGRENLLARLSEHLGDKRMFLLLDNFEQVVEAGPLLLALLESCPYLKALITSREALHVHGEQQFVVPPLDPPRLSGTLTAASVSVSPAALLFVERARAVDPDFALDDSNAPSVAAICAQLEGLPLAIELVAARVRILSPEILLERMTQLSDASRQLNLLTGGLHDSPARHRTLREAIAWSYNLLNGQEQELFARLSVFSGGCTLDAIEAVCNPRGDLGPTSFDLVGSLLDKSLLARGEMVSAQGSGSVDGAERTPRVLGQGSRSEAAGSDQARIDPRFTMLETIREYAAEQLVMRKEAANLNRLHAEYYLALAQTADPQLTGAEQKIWLDRLERDHDNLRAALEWSIGHGDLQMAAHLGVALKRFWEVHNHYGEGRRWLGEILAASEVRGDLLPQIKAKVLNAAGALAIAQSDVNEAFSLLQSSLELQRELGDDLGVASALNNLGMAALSVGKSEVAEPLFEEGLIILRNLGDRARVATMLGNFAVVVSQLGDLERAEDLLNESLALRREMGNRWGVAAALGNLAELLRAQGSNEPATEVYTEAVVLLRELGDRVGVAKTLIGFAAISMAEERPERAVRLLGAAESLLRSTGAALNVVDNNEFSRILNEMRSALDEAAFERELLSGRDLNLDEAISYALEEA